MVRAHLPGEGPNEQKLGSRRRRGGRRGWRKHTLFTHNLMLSPSVYRCVLSSAWARSGKIVSIEAWSRVPKRMVGCWPSPPSSRSVLTRASSRAPSRERLHDCGIYYPRNCRGVIVCFSLVSLTSSRDLHGGRDGFARRRRHRRPITRGWGRSVRARHSGRRMRAARPLPAFRDSRGAPRLLPAVRAAGSAAHRSCACWRSWPSSVPR